MRVRSRPHAAELPAGPGRCVPAALLPPVAALWAGRRGPSRRPGLHGNHGLWSRGPACTQPPEPQGVWETCGGGRASETRRCAGAAVVTASGVGSVCGLLAEAVFSASAGGTVVANVSSFYGSVFLVLSREQQLPGWLLSLTPAGKGLPLL